MIFGQDRHELRKMYADAWKKQCDGLPLSPLEAQIAAVIEQHPEYQPDLENDNLDKDYLPEGGRSNPFLHMGLHLGIREQVATDRPPGVAALHRKLDARAGDPHEAEHQMIEPCGDALGRAESEPRARRRTIPGAAAPPVIKGEARWSVVLFQQVKPCVKTRHSTPSAVQASVCGDQ